MQQAPGAEKNAIIIGSGLVGSLWAVYLSRAGYKVNVYERRPDMRQAKISAGKSINLATSFRGWKALDELGIGDEIRRIAIPMYGRTLHDLQGDTSFQPYGNKGQAIWSVSRGEINCKLMDIASQSPDTKIHFNEECIHAEPDKGTAVFRNAITGQFTEVKANLVFATDGAFSAARYHGMQKLDRFDYSQRYIPDGYREILLPANPDGTYKLDKESLHIWPRGRFMLIALPNTDGSFTCTLFMPFEGDKHCFNNLNSKSRIIAFFEELFPDFYDMMPEVGEEWDQHPLSALAIIRCFPWTHGHMALMGDAAHATVPFFGQGMNCGFEDCSVMWSLMQQHGHNWPLIFKEYESLRKPNGDAVQDLSLQNYIVMRDKVTDPEFQLLQRVERRINALYPDSYFPMYSMVSFTDISYATALEKGNAQEARIRALIAAKNITGATSDEALDAIIHQFIGQAVLN